MYLYILVITTILHFTTTKKFIPARMSSKSRGTIVSYDVHRRVQGQIRAGNRPRRESPEKNNNRSKTMQTS